MQDKNKFLWRSAKEVKKYRFLMKLLPAIGGGLVAITMILYVISVMYTRYGAFSALVNKFDNVDYLLSLSETPDFEYPTSRLNAKAAENITNISVNDIDKVQDLDKINGLYGGNKQNFLAYTFYLKNVGKETLAYEYLLYVVNVTNDVDKAIRVRLYVDGEYTDYARTRSDGGGAEEGTTEFATASDIVRSRAYSFEVGDITKFTIVIWIEGDDPDCNDDLLGGQFKVDMKFSILGTE